MGAAPGTTKRADGKRFQLALEAVLVEREEANKKLTPGQAQWATLKDVAAKLLDGAAEGSVAHIKEMADRLDGKPAQAVNLGDHEGNALTINLVTYAKPE